MKRRHELGGAAAAMGGLSSSSLYADRPMKPSAGADVKRRMRSERTPGEYDPNPSRRAIPSPNIYGGERDTLKADPGVDMKSRGGARDDRVVPKDPAVYRYVDPGGSGVNKPARHRVLRGA